MSTIATSARPAPLTGRARAYQRAEPILAECRALRQRMADLWPPGSDPATPEAKIAFRHLACEYKDQCRVLKKLMNGVI